MGRGQIRWFVDDVRYATQTSWYSEGHPFPAPFDQRFHLLLNVAVGGNWPGPPNDQTTFPQEMVVDYVRVYECSLDPVTGRGCGRSDPNVEPLQEFAGGSDRRPRWNASRWALFDTGPNLAGHSSDVALSVAVVELPNPPPPDVLAEPVPFTDVYDEHFAFVWRTARRMGVEPSALDDVCQEVFLVVHRRLGEFEGRSSLRTWLFGILMRVVQVHRRSLSRKSPAHRSTGDLVDPDTLSDHRQTPDEAASGIEAVRIAHALLDQMDDDKRVAFVLSELEEMPAAEVAEAVGANINTVYARLRAARQEFAAGAARHRARDRWRFEK